MSHGSTNTRMCGTAGRENSDRESLQKSASEMSREEGMSGSYGGPRLRRAKPLSLYDSDCMVDSHAEDSHDANSPSHGHRDYRGMVEKDYDSDCSTSSVEPVETDDDADDSDTELVAGETIAAFSRMNRRLRNLDIEHPGSVCDDTLAGEPTRRRFVRPRAPRNDNLDHANSGTQSSSIFRQGLSSTTGHSGVQSGGFADLLHGDGSVLNPVDRFESGASGCNTGARQKGDQRSYSRADGSRAPAPRS